MLARIQAKELHSSIRTAYRIIGDRAGFDNLCDLRFENNRFIVSGSGIGNRYESKIELLEDLDGEPITGALRTDKLLGDLCGQLEGDIWLDFSGGHTITVRPDKSRKYEIPVLFEKDRKWDAFVLEEGAKKGKANSALLLDVLIHTAFAIDKNSMFSYTSGINIRIANNVLEIFGTTGIILSRRKVEIEYEGDELKCVIDAVQIQTLMDLLSEDCEITFEHDRNYLSFENGKETLVIQYQKGYKSVDNFFELNDFSKVIVDRKKMIKALSRIVSFKKHGDTGTASLRMNNDEILLELDDKSNKVEETLSAECREYEHPIGFDPILMERLLRHHDGEKIAIWYHSPSKVMVIEEDRGSDSLIMPKRLSA